MNNIPNGHISLKDAYNLCGENDLSSIQAMMFVHFMRAHLNDELCFVNKNNAMHFIEELKANYKYSEPAHTNSRTIS